MTVAILIVNGFDQQQIFGSFAASEALRYPWIALCLRRIEQHSRALSYRYRVLVFDNTSLHAHRAILARYQQVDVISADQFDGPIAHHDALDRLVAMTREDDDFLITLDTDAFPIRDGWLDTLIAPLQHGVTLSGIYRDEMAPMIAPYIHPSCMCVRRHDLLRLDVSFAHEMGQDVGQNITQAIVEQGGMIAPLRRSNVTNFHFLMGGIYGDGIYHHGAGSRRAKFWTSQNYEADERIRTALRDAAFTDLDHYLAVLRGEVSDDLSIPSQFDPPPG